MKKIMITLVVLVFIGWLLLKPAVPTYIEVTGQVIDANSDLPLPNADIEIQRTFNDGGLWVFLRYGYSGQNVTTKTDSSGKFRFPKVIKESRMSKTLYAGFIKVSKEEYIPFQQWFFATMPASINISMQKKYAGQKLPQGTMHNIDPPKNGGEFYIDFAANGLIENRSDADLIFIFKIVKASEVSKQSSYLGYLPLSPESWLILGELQSQGKGGIAAVPLRQEILSTFEELGDCSGLNYQDQIEQPVKGVYCVRTKDGRHFAKIGLWSWGYASSIPWVYQPNGTADVRSELSDK